MPDLKLYKWFPIIWYFNFEYVYLKDFFKFPFFLIKTTYAASNTFCMVYQQWSQNAVILPLFSVIFQSNELPLT